MALEIWQISLTAALFGGIGLASIVMMVIYMLRGRSNNPTVMTNPAQHEIAIKSMSPLTPFSAEYSTFYSMICTQASNMPVNRPPMNFYPSASQPLGSLPAASAVRRPNQPATTAGGGSAVGASSTVPNARPSSASPSNLLRGAGASPGFALSGARSNNDCATSPEYESWHRSTYTPLVATSFALIASVGFVCLYTAQYLGLGYTTRSDSVTVDYLSWAVLSLIFAALIVSISYAIAGFYDPDTSFKSGLLAILALLAAGLPGLSVLSTGNTQYLAYGAGAFFLILLVWLGSFIITDETMRKYFVYNVNNTVARFQGTAITTYARGIFYCGCLLILTRYIWLVLSPAFTNQITEFGFTTACIVSDGVFFILLVIVYYIYGSKVEQQNHSCVAAKLGLQSPSTTAMLPGMMSSGPAMPGQFSANDLQQLHVMQQMQMLRAQQMQQMQGFSMNVGAGGGNGGMPQYMNWQQ